MYERTSLRIATEARPVRNKNALGEELIKAQDYRKVWQDNKLVRRHRKKTTCASDVYSLDRFILSSATQLRRHYAC